MIDWNDDGKVDPGEVGMTFGIFDEVDEESSRKRGGSKKNGSCLSAVVLIMVFGVMVCVFMF